MALKKYFTIYRPFLQFLAIFFGVHLFFTFLYQSYLNTYISKTISVDAITQNVAKQAAFAMRLVDKNAYYVTNKTNSGVQLFYKNREVSRVVEGCNAMSIIILFASFITAFSGYWKPTLLYIIFGSILIYFCNVLRIALLSILFYELPQYKNVLHAVVFPAIIYAIVFALWVLWTTKFYYYATKHS